MLSMLLNLLLLPSQDDVTYFVEQEIQHSRKTSLRRLDVVFISPMVIILKMKII